MWAWVFFVLLGSKFVAGAVAVYMLLPADERCTICDAELLPIAVPPGAAGMLRLLRLQRRWCMECRRESLGRTTARLTAARPAPGPVAQPRLR
jgi:hypothetical protein